MKKIVPIIIAIIVIALVAMAFRQSNNNKSASSDTISKDQQSTPVQQKMSPTTQPEEGWALYKNSTSRYSVRVPNDWQIEEKQNAGTYVQSMTEVSPRSNAKPIGNLVQLTFVAMAEPSDPTPLTSQKEFDTWYTAPNDYEDGGYIKGENTTIDGRKAVVLFSAGTAGMRQMAWLREKNLNYYISAASKGGEIVTAELEAFDKILNSFIFFK